MREINLDPYLVEAILPDGSKKSFPYDVRTSICNALYFSELKLGAQALLDNDRLAQKIKAWPDQTLLLEEAEYSRISVAFESHRGYSDRDVELVRRVMEAPTVQIAKLKKPKKPATKKAAPV